LKVIASAPGKLMLFGEHAVVHKHPCLVTAVDLRVQVSLEKTNDQSLLINTPHLNAEGRSISIPFDELFNDDLNTPNVKFILASIKNAFSKFNIRQGIRIRTSGPVNSYGLGSSSAVTVATIFAFLTLFDIPFNNKLLFDLSYASVLDVQKLGSGFDVASAIYGNTIFFQTKQDPEVLKTDYLPLVIGYSGAKVSTIDLVQEVEQKRNEIPEIIDLIYETIGKITKRARTAILNNDWKTIGKLANINQGLLDSLGVNTPRLNEPILAARSSGAFGAKLSGAGGGDCMFAIIDENSRSQIEEAIEVTGAKVLHLGLNAEGVRLEK
jgi:mevalonate kinase